MILLRLCRYTLLQLLVILVIISSLLAPPAYCQETEDSQVFIAGFNAYQQKDYATSIEKLNEVLKKYPDTPLKDMTLFWLSRSYYKVGNQQEAARYLSQLSKEYPDSPLKNTVEDELLSLMARYDKGEKLPTGPLAAKQADLLATRNENAEKMRVAAAQAEAAKQAAAAAESARTAALKKADEIAVAQRKETARAAAAHAEQEKIAAAKNEEALRRSAKAKETLQSEAAAETARITAQKAEVLRLARIQAEKKRAEQAEAELAHMNAQKAENERKAAAEKAEQKRLAIAKTEETTRAAAAAESARTAALKAEKARLAEQKLTEEKAKAEQSAYREKAIAQYKTIIDKFPTSAAAVTAAAKLRELGIAVVLPPQAAAAPMQENSQILHLEVAQFAGFEFTIPSHPDAFTVGRPASVPFEVINRGNGTDSFYLESAFPADFKTRFAAASAPRAAISHTPPLAPGETFKGIIDLVIPPASIDGLRISYPVKAASRLMPEASQSREVRLIASAPLLRAVMRTDRTRPLPGDKLVYHIAILNVGSTVAEDVNFRLSFPPQLDPVDYAASGFKQEMKSALALDGLRIKSGESREFTVTFQLKDDSLAGQELAIRAELSDTALKTTAAFVSNMATVETQRGISVRAGYNNLIAIPGQAITLPFVVTNTGNIREKLKIHSVITAAQSVVIFNDLNRDGIREAGEPAIDEIGPLAPREEATIAVEIKAPLTAADGSRGTVTVSFVSEGDATRSASGSTQLTYSRPVLKMVMSGHDGRLKPGDVASFDLAITNNGSNIARLVELQSLWPEQLDLVAADPATTAVSNGTVIWRFKELGSGEKRNITVSFRVKPGTGVGTALQVKNMLTYEDQLGNRY